MSGWPHRCSKKAPHTFNKVVEQQKPGSTVQVSTCVSQQAGLVAHAVGHSPVGRDHAMVSISRLHRVSTSWQCEGTFFTTPFGCQVILLMALSRSAYAIRLPVPERCTALSSASSCFRTRFAAQWAVAVPVPFATLLEHARATSRRAWSRIRLVTGQWAAATR